ncbi:hypothetical protein E2C01_023127 [Portunus trituberculatus]|uniref:Uncharacterized protein n=1 Tax=Portunus trituberculatus TaxID=210409 RepID=A0A5B7E9J9_PORTR|nr:hypothetical protein [Portunus trituberculatus]
MTRSSERMWSRRVKMVVYSMSSRRPLMNRAASDGFTSICWLRVFWFFRISRFILSSTLMRTRERASAGKFWAVWTRMDSCWSGGADMMRCAAWRLRCCSCHTFMGAISCCDSIKCLRSWFRSSFFSGWRDLQKKSLDLHLALLILHDLPILLLHLGVILCLVLGALDGQLHSIATQTHPTRGENGDPLHTPLACLLLPPPLTSSPYPHHRPAGHPHPPQRRTPQGSGGYGL